MQMIARVRLPDLLPASDSGALYTPSSSSTTPTTSKTPRSHYGRRQVLYASQHGVTSLSVLPLHGHQTRLARRRARKRSIVLSLIYHYPTRSHPSFSPAAIMSRTDPQLSTAKRKQRTQVFTSHMAHASLERQLAALQTSKSELETKLREKDVQIDRLEGDRRWLAEREQEEREEKERERNEREEEKVCMSLSETNAHAKVCHVAQGGCGTTYSEKCTSYPPGRIR